MGHHELLDAYHDLERKLLDLARAHLLNGCFRDDWVRFIEEEM